MFKVGDKVTHKDMTQIGEIIKLNDYIDGLNISYHKIHFSGYYYHLSEKDLELAEIPHDCGALQSLGRISYKFTPVSQNNKLNITVNGFGPSVQSLVNCCSKSKNIKDYINFYDRKVKYCNCCGNTVK